MKKILALFLGIIMLLSFAACTPNGDDTTPSGGSTPGNTSDPGGGSETGNLSGTITVWTWDPAFNIFAMQEAAKIYKEINPDFEINIVEVPWDDIQTRIILAATGNQLDTLPDIFLVQDMAFQMNVMNYPEAFADLTNSGINFSEFGSAKVGFSAVDGRNYGVPFDAGTAVLALRTDILAQAGLTIADFTDITWDRFIELGQIVLEETGIPLYSDRYRETDLIMMMVQSAGASMWNADGSPNIVGNAVLEEVMSVFVRLIDTGVALMVNNWDEYIASIVNGTVAGTINGCWILGSIQTAEDQAGNWALTNIPRLNAPGATNFSNNGGSSWAIASSSPNQALAIDFLNHTFAGSVEFYDIILPSSGAIGTWIPAGDSVVYSEPQDFFAGQRIFYDIVSFTARVPSVDTGIHYYEARNAIGLALAAIVEGMDMQRALQEAEDTVRFAIQ